MRHFLTTEDWSRDELQAILDEARVMKKTLRSDDLRGRTVVLIFFNPSLRTRASFEIGAFQMGGHAVVLEPGASGSGRGAWPIAFEEGAVMDGAEEEHVKEAARVLSRYADLIAVRAFPKFENWQVDREDQVLRAFARYATVPVINMETIVHPCQELALMLAIEEHLGKPDGRKFVLTWTYHPRPLNTAVANSALLIATKFGMDVTLLCPTEEYLLDDRYMIAAQRLADDSGGSLTVTHEIERAYTDAEFIYAKSWGALPWFGRWEKEKPIRDAHRHFIVDEEKMSLTNNAYFSHCLPMRRNLKATDAVADSPRSLIIEEAANRLHVQKALMKTLVSC